MELALDEVDVAPTQAEGLGQPKAGVGEHGDDGAIARSRMPDERREVGFVEHATGASRPRPRKLSGVEARDGRTRYVPARLGKAIQRSDDVENVCDRGLGIGAWPTASHRSQ